MPPTDPATDPHAAAALARAERRRERLEELSELGMGLARELTTRFIDGPYHPEPRHDPGRAFAAVSRTVRFTLAMEAKVDDHILALRKGEAPKPARVAAAPSAPRESKREAIDETRDEADEERACAEFDGLYERLTEPEHDDAPLSRPWRESVETIRGELGVAADQVLDRESTSACHPGRSREAAKIGELSDADLDLESSGACHPRRSREAAKIGDAASPPLPPGRPQAEPGGMSPQGAPLRDFGSPLE